MTSKRVRDDEGHLLELLQIEQALRQGPVHLIAGVDEAGRGPLAGPVVAAAVVFAPETRILGIDDSKRLLPERRAGLFDRIQEAALGVGIGVVDHAEIDRVNILNATFRAMHQALERLPVCPDHLIIDGDRFDGGDRPFTAIIDGDEYC
ncbi:MAG TPA: ribonuclease HII, partial [Bacteroidota bacterium]